MRAPPPIRAGCCQPVAADHSQQNRARPDGRLNLLGEILTRPDRVHILEYLACPELIHYPIEQPAGPIGGVITPVADKNTIGRRLPAAHEMPPCRSVSRPGRPSLAARPATHYATSYDALPQSVHRCDRDAPPATPLPHRCGPGAALARGMIRFVSTESGVAPDQPITIRFGPGSQTLACVDASDAQEAVSLLGPALSTAAKAASAALVDGGTASGVMRIAGQARPSIPARSSSWSGRTSWAGQLPGRA